MVGKKTPNLEFNRIKQLKKNYLTDINGQENPMFSELLLMGQTLKYFIVTYLLYWNGTNCP